MFDNDFKTQCSQHVKILFKTEYWVFYRRGLKTGYIKYQTARIQNAIL